MLKDENGAKVESITKEEDKMRDMNLTILSKWLQREGMQPPPWSTVLKESNLHVLAEEIKAVIGFWR